MLSYGVYIVSSKKEGKFNAQIANSVFQITSEPPRIAISINKNNLTHEFIEESGVFAVSVLKQETPFPFIGIFGFRSGRDIDKFQNCKYIIGKTGCPVVTENSLAYMEFKVSGKFDFETHTIFIGEMVAQESLEEGEPLTYAYYKLFKKGKSPKSAPTYVKE
ncbi:MAG: flavin reductase family protein [Candidatus Aminicenantia bacterium]